MMRHLGEANLSDADLSGATGLISVVDFMTDGKIRCEKVELLEVCDD